MPFTFNGGGSGLSQVSSRRLASAVSGNGLTKPKYVASLTFAKDDRGDSFNSGLFKSCELSVNQVINGVSQPLAGSAFAARWNTAGGHTGRLTDVPNTSVKTFAVSKPRKKHTFVIHFVNSQPKGTTNELTVTWRR